MTEPLTISESIGRLFKVFPRGASSEQLRAYVREFSSVDEAALEHAISAIVREWDKVSIPPPGEIHKRMGTRQPAGRNSTQPALLPRFTPDVEAAGKLIFKLAMKKVFWCHESYRYLPSAEVGCTLWPNAKCNRAIGPTPAETREAFVQYIGGEQPKQKPRKVAPATSGTFERFDADDSLAEMF